MKLQLLFFVFLLSQASYSQNLQIDIRNPLTQPCPSDPSVTIYTYENWAIYQTEDNSWSGQRYLGSCPNLLEEISNNGSITYKIDLSTIDSERALFLAYEGPEEELDQNKVYGLASFFNPNQEVPIRYGDDCPNGMCSGLIIRSRHHDQMSSDTLVCNTYYPYTRTNQCELFPCYNSEKTDRNTLITAIYKLSLEGSSDKEVTPGSVSLEDSGLTQIISEATLTVNEAFFNGTEYQLALSGLLSGWPTYLVGHNVPGLPSETNQSFTELEPEEYKAEPTTINIDVNYEILQFQKYSHLIGALVEANEQERHPVNINFMMDQCLFAVELIGTGGTNFRMAGGTIEFSDKAACLQVRDNSAIYIEEGQQVYMGRDGVGNVNLRSGGSIVIKKDAEMIFGGKLILTSYKPYEGDEEIHIDLQDGGHLEFTEDAKIRNKLYGNELFLYVYMNGGTIDLTKLSDEDRAKVILVYPETMANNSDLKVFPNPTQEVLTIYNPKLETIEKVALYNLHGQVVFSKNMDSDSPALELELGELTAGLYTLSVDYENEQRVAKLIIE